MGFGRSVLLFFNRDSKTRKENFRLLLHFCNSINAAAAMAARLLSRSTSKTLNRVLHYSAGAPTASAAVFRSDSVSSGVLPPSNLPRSPLHRPIGSPKIWGYDQVPTVYLPRVSQSILRWCSTQAQEGATMHPAKQVCSQTDISNVEIAIKPLHSKVMAFSPLEAAMKARASGLGAESLKLNRIELANRITFVLIPALLLVSKTKLTTSAIILATFWQIHGFFKEIFLDYVHQEVTRTWVLIYFKLLLLILAKDMFLHFDMI